MVNARMVVAAVLGVVFIGLLGGAGCVVENVQADRIVAIQYPTGGLKFVTTQGPTMQWFGSTTSYPKRDIYHFENVSVRFNDGGDAKMTGTVQFDLPTDNANLYELHSKYGSSESIKAQIIGTVVNKVLPMTGPHLSSKESYAEKRTDLIRLVQDQIDHGVYRVVTKTVEVIDPLSGQKTTQNVASIALNSQGQPVRQEASIVAEFGIKAFNFAIQSIDYSDIVDKQIAQQQEATMAVQTAQANARKAEQDRITAEQLGQAEAAKWKWDAEKYKAKAIVTAEQARDVANLEVKTAEAYKAATLLRADGDAEARRRIMSADGALAQKLATLEKINAQWAEAFSKSQQPLVPGVVMGGTGTNAVSSAQNLMDLLMINSARQLQLDLRPMGSREKDK